VEALIQNHAPQEPGRRMEVFENAAGAGAQLLKIERLAQAGDAANPLTSALLLTFDVGRILLTADPARGRLLANAIPDSDAIPGGLVDASEEEPWWRLLGCSLAAATSAPEAISLQLEFRISGGQRRMLDLSADGGAIRAGISEASG
jgi:hypothetical protein